MKRKLMLIVALVMVLACVFAACNQGFTVTFDLQNGQTLQVKFDEDFALPTDVSNGDKVFDGWYADKACTTPWTIPTELTKDVTVYAKWKDADNGNGNGNGGNGNGNGGDETDDIDTVLAKYQDVNNINCTIALSTSGGVEVTVVLDGEKSSNRSVDDENDVVYTDYVDLQNGVYYNDNGDGDYDVFDDPDDVEYYLSYYFYYVDLSELSDYIFTASNNGYVAANAHAVGNSILGDWGEDCTWTSVTISIANGNVSKIVAVQEDTSEDYAGTYTFTLVFSKWGTSSVTLPEVGGGELEDADNDPTLQAVLAQYKDESTLNYEAGFAVSGGSIHYVDTIKVAGDLYCMTYEDEGVTHTDYIDYEKWVYYLDNADGTWEKITDEFEFMFTAMYADYVGVQDLCKVQFVPDGSNWKAQDANTAGNLVFGEEDDCTWTSFTLTVTNGNVSKIVAVQEDTSEDYAGTYTYTVNFSKWGQTTVTLPTSLSEGEGEGGNEGGGESGEGQTTVITSVFTDKNLSNSSEIKYSANVAATDMDTPDYNRGVQFNKPAQSIVVTSTSVSNVTKVVVSVATNITNGMTVSASVGNTALTPASKQVNKGTSKTEVEFTSSTAVSGAIVITLTPDASYSSTTKGSIYIYSVTVTCGTSGGSSSGGEGGNESGGSQGGTTGNVMPTQQYDAATFDNNRLQDKLFNYEEETYGDGAIGLPSVGEYHVLVIPVQVMDSTFTIDQTALEKLNKAFNGTSADTGWESVRSYYLKDSFGKLNLTFDIYGYTTGVGDANDVCKSKNNASYYSRHTATAQNGKTYNDGDEVLMLEALAYVASKIDVSKYDYNHDGYLDGVYIIYSEAVDYEDSDFWWAYVTQSTTEKTYDELTPYYYLFAGFDFMNEDLRNSKKLLINAETYIHETGHMLGLDDYYDYSIDLDYSDYEQVGGNYGMGGASMQDFNVGEHDSYSRIMLNWLTPTIVTSTTTVTLDISNDSTNTSDNCIMVLLNSNNSYFCEYLLIDLYSANGLNQVESSQMYGGANCGVRIYHVSSSCDNPYSDDYWSFTDNNNSITKTPLIKLVEADGEKTKNDTDNEGYWAEASDLWQAEQKLNTVFSGGYKRNDGKVVNFDVEIVSVSATQATVTITFAE